MMTQKNAGVRPAFVSVAQTSVCVYASQSQTKVCATDTNAGLTPAFFWVIIDPALN